jgi:hypothetical protein
VKLYVGDLEPALVFDLTATPTPDLSTASVQVRGVHYPSGDVFTNNSPGVVGLVVTHNWVSPQTNKVGRIFAEVIATWPGARPQTFPDDQRVVEIRPHPSAT